MAMTMLQFLSRSIGERHDFFQCFRSAQPRFRRHERLPVPANPETLDQAAPMMAAHSGIRIQWLSKRKITGRGMVVCATMVIGQ